MTIQNRLVVHLYMCRMKSICNDYSLIKFRDYQELCTLLLKSKSTIKSLRLIDKEVFKLNKYEIKDLRDGLKEGKPDLFNRAYKNTMLYVFESIYNDYVKNGQYEKLYEQCYRRSLLPELMKTISKFDHEKYFIGIY